jgi:YVTN family beta-propeller protein
VRFANPVRSGVFLLFILPFLFVASGSPADGQAGEPATALLNGRAIALNPRTGKIYAVAPRENAVAVFEPARNSILRVSVGAGPVALAVNPSSNRIYVANSAGGSVSVLDGVKDTVLATLDVGANPYVVAADQITDKIYVSNTFSDLITIIDGSTNSITKLKAGSADAIVIDERLGKVFLLGYETPDLTLLDNKPAIRGKLKVGMHLWAIAVNETAQTLYITRSGNSELAVVDEISGSVSAIPTGKTPCAVELNRVTNIIYVVNHTGDSVTAIDAAKHAVIATIKVGHRPQGIAIDSVRNRIYIANRNDDSISVIDGAQNVVVQTLRTGKNPFALATNQNTGQLFATTIAGPALELVAGQ